MYKVKNVILITISLLMALLFAFSVASIDSPSLLPLVSLIISGTWLAAFAAANGWLDVGEEVDFSKDFPNGLEIRAIRSDEFERMNEDVHP